MTPSDRAALLALAEAAATNAPDWYMSEVVKAFALNNGGYEADAPFIVAASPHRVKALLAALSAAEAERDAARNALRTAAGLANEMTWRPATRPFADRLANIIRAALAPATPGDAA